MEKQSNTAGSLTIVRVAFWGQVIGFLVKAAFLAYEDAPDVFARVTPLTFLVPLVGLAALYLLRLDRFVAANVGPTALAAFTLLTSGSTTLLGLLSVVRAYRIPEFLVTRGWEYTRTTSVFALVLFAISLAVNVYLVVRGRGAPTSTITRDSQSSRQGTTVRR
jgi:hypothetical protein